MNSSKTVSGVTFWFVWNPGNRAPTKKHSSLASARKEAERLASTNPGQEFVVLQSVGSCRTQNTVWEEHSAGISFDFTGGSVSYIGTHSI